MLLPPGPDTVQKSPSRKTQPSSPLTGARPHKSHPRAGIRPRYSGLRVQGTATSPSSTANASTGRRPLRSSPGPHVTMAERVGFEPTRQALHPSTRSPGERLQPLSHLSTPWPWPTITGILFLPGNIITILLQKLKREVYGKCPQGSIYFSPP